MCKVCNKEYQQWHYANNKLTYGIKAQKRREDWIIWWRDFRKTLQCEICAENHTACLDFHHLDKDNKDMDVSKAVHNGWSKERILREINKCQILCSNCHRKLHWSEKF